MMLKSGRKSLWLRLFRLSLIAVTGSSLLFASFSFAQGDDTRAGQPKGDKAVAGASSPYAVIPQGRATTTTAVVVDQNLRPMLSEASPIEMQAVESRYAAIVSAGGWPQVSKGTYRKGASNNKIAALNQRLFIEGYLSEEATKPEFATRYTTATAEAVSRFQRNHGLAVSGTVDGATLKALNIPAEVRLSAIRSNIPRIAEYSQNLGNRYVVVNVPAQQIESVENGRVYSQHNAIVGRPERPTPVVMTALSDVAFNPYWNAPPSIVERDVLPKIRAGDTTVLDKMKIHVFQGVGGPEVDPKTLDWDTIVVDDYHFRQEPGPENAMATAKINFHSPFGIYLHDTPERYLFNVNGRFFSSGCVRVDKIAILINWILNGQDGFDPAKITQMGETLERLDVKLVDPPQLRVAYLTAWPTGNGVAAFRNDVYDMDASGFVVGQPMPVGENASDGQRYVLKPIARQQAAVDAAEAEGFSIFGGGSKASSGGQQASAGSAEKPKKAHRRWLFDSGNRDSRDDTRMVGRSLTTEDTADVTTETSGGGKQIVKSNKPEAKATGNSGKVITKSNVRSGEKVKTVAEATDKNAKTTAGKGKLTKEADGEKATEGKAGAKAIAKKAPAGDEATKSDAEKKVSGDKPAAEGKAGAQKSAAEIKGKAAGADKAEAGKVDPVAAKKAAAAAAKKPAADATAAASDADAKAGDAVKAKAKLAKPKPPVAKPADVVPDDGAAMN